MTSQSDSELRDYLRGKSFQVGLEDHSTPKANYFYLSYEAIDELMQLIAARDIAREKEIRKDTMDQFRHFYNETTTADETFAAISEFKQHLSQSLNQERSE